MQAVSGVVLQLCLHSLVERLFLALQFLVRAAEGKFMKKKIIIVAFLLVLSPHFGSPVDDFVESAKVNFSISLATEVLLLSTVTFLICSYPMLYHFNQLNLCNILSQCFSKESASQRGTPPLRSRHMNPIKIFF